MQFEVVVFLSFMSFLAYCNRTGNYEGLNMEYKTRQHRLLTFNTEEGGDVSVSARKFFSVQIKRYLIVGGTGF